MDAARAVVPISGCRHEGRTPWPSKPSLLELARRRVVVLDGAMGANLQTRPLDLQRDWLGHENISEVLNFSRPDIIQEIHESFLAVGCDAVETNTFGANEIVMAEADMAGRVFENNKAAAEIARRACDKFETPDRPRYVVGSIGPGTKLLTLGHTDWDTMLASYAEQVRGLLAGGVDVLLIETQQDLLAIKCAIAAANLAMAEAGRRVPIMVQASFDTNAGQQMLTGSDAARARRVRSCRTTRSTCSASTAPSAPTSSSSPSATSPKTGRGSSAPCPTPGCRSWSTARRTSPWAPPTSRKGMMRFVDEFGVNIVGGCCGTMPEHLKMLCERSASRQERAGAPRSRATVVPRPQVSSLYSAEDVRQDISYLIVAERTNTNGSRQFKRLLQEENWDGLVSHGPRRSARRVAHARRLRRLRRPRRRARHARGRPPLRQPGEARRAAHARQHQPRRHGSGPQARRRAVRAQLDEPRGRRGKARPHLRLAKKYGAAVVAGTIDEDKLDAMARTAERKIAIAKRIRDLAVGQVRPARRGPPVRPARAADQHRHRGRPPQRAGDDRGHAADHAKSCRTATPSSACRTSASASSPRRAWC